MRAHLLSSLGLALGLAIATPAHADTVTCTDGTTSHTGRGACSHHGGIAKTTEGDHDKAPDVDVRDKDTPTIDAKKKEAARAATHRSSRPTVERKVKKANAGQSVDADKNVEPTENTAPAPTTTTTHHAGKATARCKDGSLSYSLHHTGTCSQHGGVDVWLDQR